MKELTDRALEKARGLGASYADIRIVNRQEESIQVKNGKVEGLSAKTDEGFGIRVLADGAWGFASSLNLDPDDIDSVAKMAVRIAQASSQVQRKPVELAPADAEEGEFAFKVKQDPFEVPVEDKLELLMDADRV
ncbi:MAG: DNA gyrase modulator, partial [Armatimonadota bacterium]